MKGERTLTDADLLGSVDDVREQTLSGIRWLVYARAGVQLVGVGSSLVIARLVPPAEFGRAAIALTVWAIGNALCAEGFGAAIVQRPQISKPMLRTAAFLGFASAAIVTLVAVLAVAPAAAAATGEGTSELVRLSAPGFLIAASATVPLAILNRRLDFRRVAINELTATSVGIGATLALALAGLNGAAIILGVLVSTLFNTILAVWAAPSVAPRPERKELASLVRFGLPVQGASAVYAMQRYGAVSVVGATLGATAAGFFQRAYGLAMEYQTKVSSIMLTIAFPVYSRMDDRTRVIDLRRRITRAHASVLFPFLLLICAQAPVLVPWLYGPEWAPAADPTSVLAIAGLGAAILTGTGPIMLAIGRPHVLFVYNLAAVTLLIAALTVGGSFGLLEACFGFLAFQLVNVAVIYGVLLRRFLGVGLRELGYDAGPALVAGAALFGVAFAMSTTLGEDAPAFVNLVASTALGIAAYAAILRLAFRDAWGDLLLMLERLVPLRRSRRSEPATLNGEDA